MFHFILLAFTVLFPHCSQIAKASLGGQCLYNTKYALQMVFNEQINNVIYINCANGKEKKKS